VNFLDRLDNMLLDDELIRDPIVEQFIKVNKEADKELLSEISSEDIRAARRAMAQAKAQKKSQRPAQRPQRSTQQPRDVDIINIEGNQALARIKGRMRGSNRIVYRYLIVTKDQLQKETGNPGLDVINIHNFIHKMNRKYQLQQKQSQNNPQKLAAIKRSYYSMYTSRPEAALNRMKKTTKPKDFKSFLKQYVGETPKAGLINALRRKPGLLNPEEFKLAMAFNDNIVNKLLRKVRSEKISYRDVVKYLEGIRKDFTPTESKNNGITNTTISEADGILSGLKHRIGQFSRWLGRTLTPEDIKWAKRGMLYDRIVDYISNWQKPALERILRDEGIAIPRTMSLTKPTTRKELKISAKPKKSEKEPQKLRKPTKLEKLRRLQSQKERYLEDVKKLGKLANPNYQKQVFNTINKAVKKGTILRSDAAPVINFISRVSAAIDKNDFGYFDEIYSELASQRMLSRLANLLKTIKTANPSIYGKPAAESLIRNYSQIIKENLDIEAYRIEANNLAKAALRVYTERCNQLRRSSLISM